MLLDARVGRCAKPAAFADALSAAGTAAAGEVLSPRKRVGYGGHGRRPAALRRKGSGESHIRAKASVSGSHCSGFKKCSSEAARARKSLATAAAEAAAPICTATRTAPAKPPRTLRWRAMSLAIGAVETSPPRPPLRRASAAEDGWTTAARTTAASFARVKGATRRNRRQAY